MTVEVERVLKQTLCLLHRNNSKGAESSLELGTNMRSEPFMKQAAKVSLSPVPPPSSVNDSYSACAVVYSFPAVKGCPLKVPFVHRLHFVIQIAPFFFEMARGSR